MEGEASVAQTPRKTPRAPAQVPDSPNEDPDPSFFLEFQSMVRTSGDELVRYIISATQKAEKARPLEVRMATDIQRVYRGFVARREQRRRKASVVHIQKVFRSHMGRKEVVARQRQQMLNEKMNYYFKCAQTIQKMWRGWRSRKFIHSYYTRKKYVMSVAAKGQEFKRQLERMYEDQVVYETQRAEDAERVEFFKLSSSLHHLLSTSCIPGIYNSPYQNEKPTAFGTAVEEHLRHAGMTVAKQRMSLPKLKVKPTPPQAPLPLHVKLRVRGPFRPAELVHEIRNAPPEKTVLTSDPYGVEKEMQWQEFKYSKMERIHLPDFYSYPKGKHDYVSSFNKGCRYDDKRASVGRTSTHRPRVISEKPFHNVVPNNREFADKLAPINSTQYADWLKSRNAPHSVA